MRMVRYTLISKIKSDLGLSALVVSLVTSIKFVTIAWQEKANDYMIYLCEIDQESSQKKLWLMPLEKQ